MVGLKNFVPTLLHVCRQYCKQKAHSIKNTKNDVAIYISEELSTNKQYLHCCFLVA